MLTDLKSQLKGLKHAQINPSQDWIASNRALLHSQIKNTVVPEPAHKLFINNIWSGLAIFLPQSFVFGVVRPIAVLLIVAMVGTSGWIATVDASYEALPGEFLYPAKRAVEKTQVTIATVSGNKKAETQLHAEFAKRRATEVKKIVAANVTDQSVVAATVQDLKVEIQTVNNKLDEIKTAAPSGASVNADTVKEVKTTTEEVRAVLDSVKENLATGTSTESAALSQTVSEAKDMAKDTAVKAVEVMVAKHLEGDTTVTKDEVKQELGKTLASAASDIVENKQNVEGVKTILEAVSTEVKGIVSQNISSGAAASTTKELTDKIVAITSSTKAASTQTDAAAIDGGKKIAEAKVLIGQDDLAGAVDKVKELTAVAKISEKINDTALQTVQSVLPINTVLKDAPAPITATGTRIEVTVTTTPVATTATGTPLVKSEIKEIKIIPATTTAR